MLYDPKWEVPTKTKPLKDWQIVLLKAAEIIETKGHGKGQMVSKNGYCLLGAIGMAAQGDPYLDFGDSGMNAVRALVWVIGNDIGIWNDKHTKPEAIAVLKEAARDSH